MSDYSISTGIIKTFGVVDYVIFCLCLLVSVAIGVFFAVQDRHQNSMGLFLLGGRKQQIIPVAMSMVATFLSALTLLGAPSEVYNYNTMYWWLAGGFVVAIAGSVRIFLPIFYTLGVTSVFEYLEMRFNRTVRLVGSVAYVTQMMVYLAFVLYAPSLALNAVTGFNVWVSVPVVGLVCTFYTTLGGMKAVLWTDTFQTVVMVTALVAILIKSSIVMGGFDQVWSIAENRSRIVFDDFNASPSGRHSIWAMVVGGGFFWMQLFGVNQAQVQRALSCPTLKKAKMAMLLSLPGLVLLLSLCCMVGVAMFAFYADCHPLAVNLISKTDQLLPLYVMDLLSDTPGLPGMFVSCLFSGSLSTLSSGLNALGAVIPQDFIRPYCLPQISERAANTLPKIIVVVSGLVMVALAFLVSLLGSLLQAGYMITAILTGPMFGLFVLGMIFPWANNTGAIVGFFSSMLLMLWINVGAFLTKASTSVKSSITTLGCNFNFTKPSQPSANNTSFISNTIEQKPPLYDLYSLSYLYYTPTAITCLVIVALIVSFITGANKPSTMDPRLISPIFDRLFPYLPERILRPLRFGVKHEQIRSTTSQSLGEPDVTLEVKMTEKDTTLPENNSLLEKNGYQS